VAFFVDDVQHAAEDSAVWSGGDNGLELLGIQAGSVERKEGWSLASRASYGRGVEDCDVTAS
jgi:hypothetical protein